MKWIRAAFNALFIKVFKDVHLCYLRSVQYRNSPCRQLIPCRKSRRIEEEHTSESSSFDLHRSLSNDPNVATLPKHH